MEVTIKKMQGAGNRIVVVDARDLDVEPPAPAHLCALGDEQTGPGFDQLMWLTDANDGNSIVAYRVFNQDGSEVEQCGNGVRCVARYLGDADKTLRSFSLQSPVGPIAARLLADGRVAVSMGIPDFAPDRVPFVVAPGATEPYRLDVDDQTVHVRVVSMGNPHCVMEVTDAATAAVTELGARIEAHSRFPERTNVGFMQVIDPRNIALRVFERGVGETRACGTGACAAVVIGIRKGALDNDVNVELPGGHLMVSWRGPGEVAWLTGNADYTGIEAIEL